MPIPKGPDHNPKKIKEGPDSKDSLTKELQSLADNLEAVLDSRFKITEIENPREFVSNFHPRVLWRGESPKAVLSLLKGEKPIRLNSSSNEPGNVSEYLLGGKRAHGAMPYRGERKEKDPYESVNIAVGFELNEQSNIEKKTANKDQKSEVAKTQSGIQKVEGSIDCPKYIVMRTPSVQEGAAPNFKVFQININENPA